MLHTSLRVFAPVVEFPTVNPLDVEPDIANGSGSIMAHGYGCVASGVCSVPPNYDENP